MEKACLRAPPKVTFRPYVFATVVDRDTETIFVEGYAATVSAGDAVFVTETVVVSVLDTSL
jgi:hypothetical protein